MQQLVLRDLVRYIEEAFTTPASGGRRTNPDWTTSRLVRLSAPTLRRLEVLAARCTDQTGRLIYPMQVAAALLDLATQSMKGDIP